MALGASDPRTLLTHLLHSASSPWGPAGCMHTLPSLQLKAVTLQGLRKKSEVNQKPSGAYLLLEGLRRPGRARLPASLCVHVAEAAWGDLSGVVSDSASKTACMTERTMAFKICSQTADVLDGAVLSAPALGPSTALLCPAAPSLCTHALVSHTWAGQGPS